MEKLFYELEQNSHIITLVGAGGKTSVMEALAAYLTKRNFSVLMTTTTHIRRPLLDEDQLIEEENLSLIKEKRTVHPLLALGIPLNENPGKWHSPSLSFLKELTGLFDFILCEGDGSKGLPLKIPRKKEPVFFPGTDTVLGIMGLSALHQPLNTTLFGCKEAPDEIRDELYHTGDGLITVRTLYYVATKPWGIHQYIAEEKFILLLNQADLLSEEDRSEINQLLNQLKKERISVYLTTAITPHP